MSDRSSGTGGVLLTEAEREALAEALGSIALTPEIWNLSPHVHKVYAVVGRILADRRAAEGDQHTRAFDGGGEEGPHWCHECSEAAQEYVEWPCSRERLVEAVRANERLHVGYETAGAKGDLQAASTALLGAVFAQHGPQVECQNRACRARGLSGMHCAADCGPHEDCDQYRLARDLRAALASADGEVV